MNWLTGLCRRRRNDKQPVQTDSSEMIEPNANQETNTWACEARQSVKQYVWDICGQIANFNFNCFTTDRNNAAGNAIASARLSARLFPFYLRNRLTVDLEL